MTAAEEILKAVRNYRLYEKLDNGEFVEVSENVIWWLVNDLKELAATQVPVLGAPNQRLYNIEENSLQSLTETTKRLAEAHQAPSNHEAEWNKQRLNYETKICDLEEQLLQAGQATVPASLPELRKEMYWTAKMCSALIDSGKSAEDIVDQLEKRLSELRQQAPEMEDCCTNSCDGFKCETGTVHKVPKAGQGQAHFLPDAVALLNFCLEKDYYLEDGKFWLNAFDNGIGYTPEEVYNQFKAAQTKGA